MCYHNLRGVGDYGRRGFGEVVGLEVPAGSFRAFADEYVSLFGADRERPDKGDRGAEYRSLVGLPGGVKSPLFPQLEAAAKLSGLRLQEGRGNDADTLGSRGLAWVMDSDKFPFRQAEVYHQFHDGFMPGSSTPRPTTVWCRRVYDQGAFARPAVRTSDTVMKKKVLIIINERRRVF